MSISLIIIWAFLIFTGLIMAFANIAALISAFSRKRYMLALYLFALGTTATLHFIYLLYSGPAPYPYPIYAIGLIIGVMLAQDGLRDSKHRV